MNLMTIYNGPKRTISASGGFGLLRRVLEPDTWCANKDVGPLMGVDCEIPH